LNCRITLEQLPGLVVLDEFVAERREFHRLFEPFANAVGLHQFSLLQQLQVYCFEQLSVVLTEVPGHSRNDSLERGLDERQRAVREVAQVGNEFVVVLGPEVFQDEFAVGRLGSVGQQLLAPDLAWDGGAHRVVTEDAGSPALGELRVLVVELLSG